MSYETGTATSHADMLNKLSTFLTKGHALSITWTGTGNGTLEGLIGTASSVQETITVTWTSATTFTVTGSVTGSMGSGTVGTAFSHARVAFTATAGGTAWANGATASFVMTGPWVALRANAGSEYIWQAPGDGGTDQIFVGASVFSDAGGDYYNWRLGGFTGYASANTFTAQPGAMTDPVIPLWNSSMPYWFAASGKRVVVVARVSGVYEMAYLGFIDSYCPPSQWSYPMAVGGSMAWNSEPGVGSASWRWSDTDNQHRSFPFGGIPYANTDKDSPLRIRKPDGTWRGFMASNGATGQIWPYSVGMTDIRPCLDGSYPLIEIAMAEDGTSQNAFGVLSGVSATAGHQNAAENMIPVGSTNWLVVQNIFRTTKVDFCAMRLD